MQVYFSVGKLTPISETDQPAFVGICCQQFSQSYQEFNMVGVTGPLKKWIITDSFR